MVVTEGEHQDTSRNFLALKLHVQSYSSTMISHWPQARSVYSTFIIFRLTLACPAVRLERWAQRQHKGRQTYTIQLYRVTIYA